LLLSKLLDFLRKKYGNNFYLFIISDHGFEGVKYRFNIGDWLVRKGYLKLTKAGRLLRIFFPFRRQIDVVYSAIEIVANFMWRFIGKRERRKSILEMLVTSSIYERSIDWDNSAVIPLTGECLYVNRRLGSLPGNFVSELMGEIASIKTPEGNLMAKQIENGKALYGSESAPDIIILPQNVNIYNAPLIRLSWSEPSLDKWTGKHTLYGILTIYGPDVNKGQEIIGATLYDIAPTILHMLGVPIPEDLDGKVLSEILKSS
jgi:predicted AlkP superfamily phosphohydrolase/phosphomutase